jgi:hypothetical protein
MITMGCKPVYSGFQVFTITLPSTLNFKTQENIMQNHEENIISYIDNCDHTYNDKVIFIVLLTTIYSSCHEDRGYHSPETLKELFPKIWKNIDGHDRNTLGKHVRHLVKNGGLPLTDAGKNSENHRQYIVNK